MTEYGIKDLMIISGTTERAIRQLFKTNGELKRLKEEHIIKKQNKVFYDEVIYNWFIEYYSDKNKKLVVNPLTQHDLERQKEESPNSNSPISQENIELLEKIEKLAAELEDLKAKYAALQADYTKIEAEKDELLRQNGNLLLLLSQEKAEKQALLPPPRKTIGERIKRLFGGRGGEK